MSGSLVITEWQDSYGTPKSLDEQTTGLDEEALRTLRWMPRPRTPDGRPIGALPAIRELNGLRRTAFLNDLARLDATVQIRLKDPKAAAERAKLLDRHEVRHGIAADGAAVVVHGPHPNAWLPGRWPERDYTITTEWRDFPVVFANWLDYAVNERAELGAWFLVDRLEKAVDPDINETVIKPRRQRIREVDLFAFRLPAEIPPDETASGLKLAKR